MMHDSVRENLTMRQMLKFNNTNLATRQIHLKTNNANKSITWAQKYQIGNMPIQNLQHTILPFTLNILRANAAGELPCWNRETADVMGSNLQRPNMEFENVNDPIRFRAKCWWHTGGRCKHQISCGSSV